MPDNKKLIQLLASGFMALLFVQFYLKAKEQNIDLGFGMVNVLVKLYSATESKSIHFHEVHAKNGARIEHRRICPREDKEVPYKEVVKG